MQLTLHLDIPPLPQPISYKDRILLIGSCFTEHISDRLAQHKFRTCANPHGILFNPLSVASALDSYVAGRQYREDELFYLNELWNSWDHHTRFSDISLPTALEKINNAQSDAAQFIRSSGWILITLGSAFQYYRREGNRPVANNHRAPSQWFEKRLLDVPRIVESLSGSINNILSINPDARFLFTVSPVRHIRDGVVDNNRSKARLIEAVHELCSQFPQATYFPAYELVIDILRDYRFYDIDFVHPNYLATQFVWEQFAAACISSDAKSVMGQVREIVLARSHRPRFPQTVAHQKFLSGIKEKIDNLLRQHPYLDLGEEQDYFSAY